MCDTCNVLHAPIHQTLSQAVQVSAVLGICPSVHTQVKFGYTHL